MHAPYAMASATVEASCALASEKGMFGTGGRCAEQIPDPPVYIVNRISATAGGIRQIVRLQWSTPEVKF